MPGRAAGHAGDLRVAPGALLGAAPPLVRLPINHKAASSHQPLAASYFASCEAPIEGMHACYFHADVHILQVIQAAQIDRGVLCAACGAGQRKLLYHWSCCCPSCHEKIGNHRHIFLDRVTNGETDMLRLLADAERCCVPCTECCAAAHRVPAVQHSDRRFRLSAVDLLVC